MKWKSFSVLKRGWLKDPEVRAEYERLKPEFDLARMLIRKRIDADLTQKQLATKMKTKQSAISRLESGRANPSFQFLQKVATALGGTLKIAIQ